MPLTVTANGGKILAVGTTGNGQFALARYVDEPGQSATEAPICILGLPDKVTTAFGNGNATATAVAMDCKDGYIVVAGIVVDGNGHNEVALARYNDADGSLDTNLRGWSGHRHCRPWDRLDDTHAVTVSATATLWCRHLQRAIRPLAFRRIRQLDTSFGGTSDGLVLTSFGGTSATPSAMTMIAPAKSSWPARARRAAPARISQWHATLPVARCTRPLERVAWSRPTSAGITTWPMPSRSSPDGKIVLAGYSQNSSGNDSFALARYNVTGSLDTSFGTGGLVTSSFGDGHDHADWRGHRRRRRGSSSPARPTSMAAATPTRRTILPLLRLNSDGSPDTNFGTGDVLGGVDDRFQRPGLFDRNRPPGSWWMPRPADREGTATQSGYSSFAIACYDPGHGTHPLPCR